MRDGTWLGKQEFPPLAYHVDGIIPEGLTVLAGAPKVGKSWFVLGTALAVASGGAALGKIRCQQRHVFYLALEDGDRRMQDRCRTLLANPWRPDDPIPGEFTYMTRIVPGQIIATIAEYLETYGMLRPLVIVDTLGRVLPPAFSGETPYSRDYRVMSQLKDLADGYPGAALLLCHHDRKAVTDRFRRLRVRHQRHRRRRRHGPGAHPRPRRVRRPAAGHRPRRQPRAPTRSTSTGARGHWTAPPAPGRGRPQHAARGPGLDDRSAGIVDLRSQRGQGPVGPVTWPRRSASTAIRPAGTCGA